MIPKIIHYCWFGKNPLPKSAKNCIKSWKKYCPEYEIILWNENNFDLDKAPLYVKQAYEEKKWAFVTDYVRLWCVYHNGGIYFDTDVELIQNIDKLLLYDAFFGFEDYALNNEYLLNTGIGFGAVKNHILIGNILNGYNDISFINNDGTINLTTCPQINRIYFVNFGFRLDNSFQIIDNVAVFPSEYFCPKNWKTKQINTTPNTISIHHFDATWHPKRKKKSLLRRLLIKILKVGRRVLKKEKRQ